MSDKYRVCDRCRKRTSEVWPPAWLHVTLGQFGEFWFCSWGCLRDYCDATVVDA